MSVQLNAERDQSSPGTEAGSLNRDHAAPDRPSGPNKRRRVALACSNCRHRKSRCDGRRPRCSLCTELGCDCIYEQGGVATNLTVGKTYIDRLEKRLADIESALARVQSTQLSAAGACNPIEGSKPPDNDNSNVVANAAGTALGTATSSIEYQMNGGVGEVDSAEDSIDAMGAIKFTDEEDWGYFGPSSNIAFLRHISLALTRAGDHTQTFPPPTISPREVPSSLSVSRPHIHPSDSSAPHLSGPKPSVNIYALPSEARIWSLIREYFQKTGQLLPFVHEESFCATYFEMKRNNFTKARRTWLGLLNIILAMATTLYVEDLGEGVSAERRIEESDVYYQRANGLCDKESQRNISLELVQYMLILGQYLQSTLKSVQAWTVHGLAITTALQLGLHSPKTNKGFPPLECEIRKRAWYGCVLLDRTLSMTFGRPAMIPENYLKLDLPISDLQVVGQTPQANPGLQMDALFYTASIKLYEVMYKIIDTCYGQNLGQEEPRTDTELISLVLKVEERLDRWTAQLPSLQMRVYNTPFTPQDLDKMKAEDKINERFTIVLSVRYHNLQILLHRPILEKFLEASTPLVKARGGERGKVQQLGMGSIETCVDSAVMVISIVHGIVGAGGWRRDLLGAWNYSLFYTFNAGLVIFAAMHVARTDIQNDPKRLSRWEFVENALPYFNMAIEALSNLDRGNRVVERCVSYLSQLVIKPISSDFSDGLTPNRPADSIDPAVPRAVDPSTAAYHHQSLARILDANRHTGPTEIDLNEFMLDTDLDFFTRHFDMVAP